MFDGPAGCFTQEYLFDCVVCYCLLQGTEGYRQAVRMDQFHVCLMQFNYCLIKGRQGMMSGYDGSLPTALAGVSRYAKYRRPT
jgi:hypothetical protein